MAKFAPGNTHAFQAGKSGNPNGRSKALRSVEELAKTLTADAMSTLAEVCRDVAAPAASRVTAAVAILDRGWGKPRQELQVTMDAHDLSDEALLAIVAKGQDDMAAEEEAAAEAGAAGSLH